MDRQKFKDEYEAKKKTDQHYFDHEKLIRILYNNREGKSFVDSALVISVEELCELAKEITKCIRSKADFTGLLEELADVQIIIYQLIEYFGFSVTDLFDAMQVKLDQYKE